MAYVGNPTKLPDGLAGLALRENRLLSKPTEYIDAEGVTFEDHHARKEAGAISIDSVGLSGAPRYDGTISVSEPSGGGLTRLDGTTIVPAGTAASKDATSTGLTQTVTVPAGGYTSSTLVVVHIVVQGVTASVTSVTDTQGNTYTAFFSGMQNVGNTIVSGRWATYASVLGTTLAAGNVITITYNSILSRGAIVVGNWSGVTSAVPAAFGTAPYKQNSGTAVAIGPLFSASPPYLEVVGLGAETGVFSPLGTPVFTELIELNGTHMTAALHYRTGAAAPTIIAMYDFLSDQVRLASTSAALSGSAATAAGSAVVTGSGGSLFTTEIFEGDFVQIGTEIRKVLSIASDTSLTTETTWVTTNAAGDYSVRAGQRLITAATDGGIYREHNEDLDYVSLVSAGTLSISARPGRFVQGGKEAAAVNHKLFYLNGVDSIRVLNGDESMAVISTPHGDWTGTNQPLNGVVHRNRLVVWGNRNDPHRIYISNPDDHEDFTDPTSTTQRVGSNIGERLIGGVSFNGVLWLFKNPRGLFYLEDQDLSVSNWAVFTKSEALGCTLSPYSVLALDDDVLFLTPDGAFHLLSAVNTLGGVEASDLSEALGIDTWINENVNLKRLDQVTSVWYPAKSVALFGVPGTGEESNTLTLKFDFAGVAQGQPVKFSYSRRDSANALAVERDSNGIERPILGEAGEVYRLDQEDRNKDGEAYDAAYQTPHLDFSHVSPELEYKRKIWQALELIMKPVSAGTVTVEAYVDEVLRQTLTFDATLRRQRKTLHVGDGFTLSLRVTNSTVDEDFRILSKSVFFEVGNEDYSRAV